MTKPEEQVRLEAIALDQATRAFFGPAREAAKVPAYYVVTGIWRETGEREAINGFYSRREAMEEACCHKHTHSKLLIAKIEDTPEAMEALIAGFAQ